MHILPLVTIWYLPFKEKSYVCKAFWPNIIAIISPWAAEQFYGITLFTPEEISSLVSLLNIAAANGPPVFLKMFYLAKFKT